MVVQRLAAGPSRYRPLVVGPPFEGMAFPDIAFAAARVPRWLPMSVTQRYAVRLAQILRTLPPGLIEVHNKPDVAMWLARFFPRRPVTLFLHNDPRSMRGAKSPQQRQRLLGRLARVITVSEFLRGALLENVGSVSRDRQPLVMHNTLDLSILPELVPPERRDKKILFAGRVVPDKAPDVFVAACAAALPALPGWSADIIGTDGFGAEIADSGFIRRLRPQAAAAGIAMLGHQPHDMVLQAMARAAVVVVPSRWQEPFGMTALEAIACGAALVCSQRGGLAEVAGDACVPIDPENPVTVAQALIRLAGDADLRASLSAAGQRRAHRLFSAGDAIARLDDLRDEIFASNAANARNRSA
jgi:glycosyltransferase involved in cell wall biosynthesis